MTSTRYLIMRYTLTACGTTSISHLLLWLMRDEPPTWLFSFLLVNLIWFLSFKEAISVVTAGIKR